MATHPAPGTVRLQVANLDRSLRYYESVLGLAPIGREAGLVTLGTADGHALVHLDERPGAAAVPRLARYGLFHFALLVPDRASLGRFAAHVARLGAPVAASDHGVSEALYLWDPDGLGIEVYADRPSWAWPHRGDRLLMTTEPLNLDGLMRAAGPGTWEQMPAGTVLGHVHLHVGDLARAATFYGEGLGLDITVRDYPGALFLAAGGYHHHVGVNTWATRAEAPGAGEAQLLEWELVFPTEQEARGARDRLAASPDGLARDPWGTAVVVRGP